jgi:glycine cleavage system transcriptional repressor
MVANSDAKAVIATLAEDRPGLVSELSAIVHGLGLNIEDSRMTVLGGEFAVLMGVAGEESALAELEAQLAEKAAEAGFVHLFRRTADRSAAEHQPFTVSVESMDHPGIVSGVTRFFSERSVNIRELSTDTDRAPHTGTPVFSLTMEIEVSSDQAIGELRESFAAFCEAEGLDGELIAL